ncbi:conserved hypothetical protein [Azospirillaceae bacterium]
MAINFNPKLGKKGVGSQVATGAKLELRIGTIPVAYASQCSYTYNINVETIQGVDQLTVDEHAEVGTTVTFTASMFRVAFKAAVTNGWQPKLKVLLQQPELVAIIKDKISGVVLAQISGLKLTSRSGTVAARGTFTETLTFVGKIFEDEEL